MTIFKNMLVLGGSVLIMKDIADRVRLAATAREKALWQQKAAILALGVTVGGVIGAVTGILVAPMSGKETREDLTRRSSNAWGKIRKNASHAGSYLLSAVEEESSRVSAAAEKCVDAAHGALAGPREEEARNG